MANNDGTRRHWNDHPYAITPDVPVYRHEATTGLVLKTYTAHGNAPAGAVTFTLPAGYFTAVHSVIATAVRDTTDARYAVFATVRTYTTSSVVVAVWDSKTSVTLLGSVTEGLELSPNAASVLLTVFGT
jgi:hypothetical protein